ncbi:phospholipase A2 family protein [Wolffia australiana]
MYSKRRQRRDESTRLRVAFVDEEQRPMATVNRRTTLDASPAEFLLAALLLFLCSSAVPVAGLNVGIQTAASDGTLRMTRCSRKCESEYCTLPPFLRYGKYCGLLYSGCPGEKPCDGLDACCQIHDACVQAKHNDYLSQSCNQNFLNCIQRFKYSGKPTFKGNKCSPEEVVDVISLVIEAAVLAGRALHKP